MIRKVAFGTGLALVALSAMAAKLNFPQTRAATDAEINEYQSLGRIVPAPDGSFFLYEWSRPYNWAPDVDWLAPAAAKRTQTWMYRVDTGLSDAATSHYVFHPGSGATYYLGDLSPDSRRVTFYEIDHDDNVVKAGVVTFDDTVTPTIDWFDAAPDSAKLDKPAIWLSDDEFVYPTKKGWVKAKVPAKVPPEQVPLNRLDWDKPAVATACADCDTAALEKKAMEKARADKARVAQKSEPPKNSKLAAVSKNGELAIFAVDTPQLLSLSFQSGGGSKVLFENERHPQPYVPPKSARTQTGK